MLDTEGAQRMEGEIPSAPFTPNVVKRKSENN